MDTVSQAATIQAYEAELMNKFCDSNIEPQSREDEPPQIKIHSIPNYKNIRKSEISSCSTPRYFSPPKQADTLKWESQTPTETKRIGGHYLTPKYVRDVEGGKKRSITLNNPAHLVQFQRKRKNSSRITSIFQGIWKTIFGNDKVKKSNKSMDSSLQKSFNTHGDHRFEHLIPKERSVSWSVSKSTESLPFEKVGRPPFAELEHSQSSLLSSSRIEEKVISIDLLEQEENEGFKPKEWKNVTPGPRSHLLHLDSQRSYASSPSPSSLDLNEYRMESFRRMERFGKPSSFKIMKEANFKTAFNTPKQSAFGRKSDTTPIMNIQFNDPWKKKTNF